MDRQKTTGKSERVDTFYGLPVGIEHA